jgi:hypothetical protein
MEQLCRRRSLRQFEGGQETCLFSNSNSWSRTRCGHFHGRYLLSDAVSMSISISWPDCPTDKTRNSTLVQLQPIVSKSLGKTELLRQESQSGQKIYFHGRIVCNPTLFLCFSIRQDGLLNPVTAIRPIRPRRDRIPSHPDALRILPYRSNNNTLVLLLTMTIKELRSKRVAAEIPASLHAARSGINRSRLSAMERGYIQPSEEEMTRLITSLEDLLRAKAVIQQAEASVGWQLGRSE